MSKRHVTFESACERGYLIAVDFEPDVAAVSAQPSGGGSPPGSRSPSWDLA